MKALRDLRPCDKCGGPHHGIFYVVRFGIAVVQREAVHQCQGMDQFFGGRASVALVETFVPRADDAVTVSLDHPDYRELTTEAVLCTECYCSPVLLAELAESRRHQLEASPERTSQPAPPSSSPTPTEEPTIP